MTVAITTQPPAPARDGEAVLGRKLWEHPDPSSTELYHFKSHIASKYGVSFGDETDAERSLWRWSVDHLEEFWGEVWEYTGVRASRPYEKVVDPPAPMFPRPPWFQGALLNFAENHLFPAAAVDEDSTAVIAATETTRERITWRELREQVRKCAAAMVGKVEVGDRVVGFVGNHADALVAMLAATSLGAIWSGISPDHGSTAVLDRWTQLEPTMLFADTAVFYNGRAHDGVQKLREVVAGLPSLRHVVVLHKFSTTPADLSAFPPSSNAQTYDSFLSSATNPDRPLQFTQLDPDHPVYILFSSGTTGKPKCICHGAIGTLIQHKKEHQLHCGIGPSSVFFQFTTVTWMMWMWLVSGLSSGATIVLYDGSPFRPFLPTTGVDTHHASPPPPPPPPPSGDLAMPALIDELAVTHFGTSAKYLSLLEQNRRQLRDHHPMASLRAVYSTAAVLAPSTFEYVYSAFGSVNLGSITGGTDIISLFGAPSPLVPVCSGEIQCIGLGMSVEAWDPSGRAVLGEPGDLVCTKPFPCQPVRFWGPDGAAAYEKSYFATFGRSVWHHGDFVCINPATRGLLMLGRSDGILKPAGVRFGSAEIYNVILKHFPAEVEDALCVGRRRRNDSDEAVVLFLQMREGQAPLTEELRERVRKTVRRELSARHVPAFVEQCPEIPVTTNGKKVEVVVKQVLCEMDVKVSASVANVECLEWYRKWAREH